VCKHIRALQALGLVARTIKSSIMAAWEEQQQPRRRKPALPTSADPVPPPPVKAATRRLHKPVVQDDASTFAAGWNDAVRSHIATMSAAKGGAS